MGTGLLDGEEGNDERRLNDGRMIAGCGGTRKNTQACGVYGHMFLSRERSQFGHGNVRSYIRGVTASGVSCGRWRVSTSMKSLTCTVAIDAPSWKVFNFLADPQSLVQWAVTSAVNISTGQGNWWEITMPTMSGLMRMQPNAVFGVVDFHFIQAQGGPWTIPTRVLPDGEHSSELTVTVVPPTEFGSKAMDCSLVMIDRKLDRLKNILEGRDSGTMAFRRSVPGRTALL